MIKEQDKDNEKGQIEEVVEEKETETESKEKEYIEYHLSNIYDDIFSIKLEKQKYKFVVSDLIFTFISKYNNKTCSYFEKNEIIKVIWPEWCKNIQLSDLIIFGNNKLHFIDTTNNYNIILSLVHEILLCRKTTPYGDTISGEEEMLPTFEYGNNEKYSYYLNLDNDIYLKFNTIHECGENFSYLPCQPLEDMGFLYYKSNNNAAKIDVLINFSVDFDSHKTYISRKKLYSNVKN